jgi:hypothetical protein|nr:MAG TPA: hypothetical protein [Caudoviricetes sp.]
MCWSNSYRRLSSQRTAVAGTDADGLSRIATLPVGDLEKTIFPMQEISGRPSGKYHTDGDPDRSASTAPTAKAHRERKESIKTGKPTLQAQFFTIFE